MIFARMLDKSNKILSKIYAHPFNQQLYEGTLSREAFEFYLKQDAIYLRNLSEAFGYTANRFNDRRYAQQFRSFSEEMVEAELNLNARYLRTIQPGTFFSRRQSLPTNKIPVISLYTDHLLSMAKSAPIAASVASYIPCFWIYNRLGETMNARCHEKNPYGPWMKSYSGARFTASTQLIVQTINELSSTISCPELQEQVCLSFVQSAKFELMFFDAALASQKLYEPTPTNLIYNKTNN